MRSADAHRWRGLALYGMDGTTLRIADSPENRAVYGGQNTARGESGYPSVRIVAMMALRSHVLSAFRFADYGTGETTLARGILERGAGELAGDRGPELSGEEGPHPSRRRAATDTGCRAPR